MRYRKFLMLIVPTLLMAGCSSDDASTVIPVPPTITSCDRIDASTVTGQANWDGQLPTGETPFSRLVITQEPRGQLSEFDETTGIIRYQAANESRVPDKVSYELRDAEEQVVEFREHYLIFDPLRIMPLGDSITHGVDFFDIVDNPPVPLRVGYRKALFESLTDSGHVVDFTGQAGQRAGFDAGLADPDNNGYPGVDIPFVTSKVYEVLDEGPSDVILLHIGTNQTPPTAEGVLDILDEIDRWVLTNFPVHVLVSTLVPKRDEALQLIVDEFNNDLRRVIGLRSQSSVTLVENALALSVENISLEAVGVHPNPFGYQRMAETWFDGLANNILAPECNN